MGNVPFLVYIISEYRDFSDPLLVGKDGAKFEIMMMDDKPGE